MLTSSLWILKNVLQAGLFLTRLDIASPDLNDSIVEEFQDISKKRGSGNGFKICVTETLSRHEIRARGSEGYPRKEKKIYSNTKYNGNLWDPD